MKTLSINEHVGSETITGAVSVTGLTADREQAVITIFSQAQLEAVAYLSGTPLPGEKVPVHVVVRDARTGKNVVGAEVRVVGNHNEVHLTNEGGWAGEFLIPSDTVHGGPKPISLFISAEGYQKLELHTWPAAQGQPAWDGKPHQSGSANGDYKYALLPEGVVVPPVEGRKGPVRVEGRAMLDDGGRFTALGTTLFWLPWGIQYDTNRAHKNLEYVREQRCQVVRTLHVVGYNGGAEDAWGDRTNNPKVQGWPLWESMQRATFQSLQGFGMRAIVTIFGGIELLDRAERQKVVSILRQIIMDYRHQVLGVEISNEAKVTFEEAIEHAKLVKVGNPDLVVGITAVGYGGPTFEPGVTNWSPYHSARKTQGDGGIWEYTEQPYKFKDAPGATSNQEPIGPKSSVAQDDDPERLTSEAVTGLICGATTIVLHTGSGVFGGGQGGTSRGREANLYEVPRIAEMLKGRADAIQRLPQDLSTFGPVKHSDPGNEGQFPWKTARLQPFNPGGWFLKIYAVISSDGRIAANFMKVEQDIPLEPRGRAQELTIHPCVGEGSYDVRIESGQVHTVKLRGGFYIVGREV